MSPSKRRSPGRVGGPDRIRTGRAPASTRGVNPGTPSPRLKPRRSK